MARPRKNGIEYFPFDCDFFEDDKIDYVLACKGPEAVNGYIRLLCLIYREGLCWRFGEVEKVAYARKCASDAKSVEGWLSVWLDCGLFSREIYETTGFLTSKGIQRRYFEITKGRMAVKVPQGVLAVDESEVPSNLTISYIDIKVKVKVKGNSGFSTVSPKETIEKPNKNTKKNTKPVKSLEEDRVKITKYVHFKRETGIKMKQELGEKLWKTCVLILHDWVASKEPMPGERETKEFKDARRKAYNAAHTFRSWVIAKARKELSENANYYEQKYREQAQRNKITDIEATKVLDDIEKKTGISIG